MWGTGMGCKFGKMEQGIIVKTDKPVFFAIKTEYCRIQIWLAI
jgi:hypothetical protein